MAKDRMKAVLDASEANNHESGGHLHKEYTLPKIVGFRLTSISGLLQNNPAEFIGKDEGAEALTVGKKKYDDKQEAEMRTYRNKDGAFCHPVEAFLKSAIKAVRGKKFGKLFASQTIMSNVFCVETMCPVLDMNGKPAKGYEIDRRSVVIGKSRVLRCRPLFSPWRCDVAFEIDVAILKPELFLEALRFAGRTVGVGDYRPEKGGGFGRFGAEMIG